MRKFACVRKDGSYGFVLSLHTTADAADSACAKHARALRGTNAIPEAMYGITEVDSHTKKGDRVKRIVD
jgi:hypothetical protein